MSEQHRDIETLLVDYAGALRDGCIPVFLKSLSREEAARVVASGDFDEAADLVRVLNQMHFGSRAVSPDIGLFISRVDAEIASRVKQAKAAPRHQSHGSRTSHPAK
ncbi:hypothetical protein ACFL6U_30320 [Planctomycetota bacterium]